MAQKNNSKTKNAQEKKNNEPESTQKPETKKLTDEQWENIIAITIVAILCIAAAWWFYGKLNPAAPEQDMIRQEVFIGSSPKLGNGSITVVLFSDFECSYCGSFARDEFDTIRKEQIDTGKITFSYKNYPLPSHRNAQAAAQAAACAQDQGKFWEYHDVLYNNQNSLDTASLIGYAKGLDLNEQRFEECLTSGLRISDVEQDINLGRKLGVTGTPTFFFNGRAVQGALSAEEFSQEIDKELSATK